jgi:hypothetical protein
MHTLDDLVPLAREVLGHTRVVVGQSEPAADYLTGRLDIAAAGCDLDWRPRILLGEGLGSYAAALATARGSG